MENVVLFTEHDIEMELEEKKCEFCAKRKILPSILTMNEFATVAQFSIEKANLQSVLAVCSCFMGRFFYKATIFFLLFQSL